MSFKAFPYSEKIAAPVPCVPEGYFDVFPDKIIKTIKLSEEAIAMKEGEIATPYTVPESYFDAFPIKMVRKTQEYEKVLSRSSFGDSHQMSYAVPEDYFDTFAGRVLSSVNEDNNEMEDAPLLQSLKSVDIPFELPDNYFNGMAESVLHRNQTGETDISKPGNTIAMRPHSRLAFKKVYWAAAAVLFFGLFTGGKLFYDAYSNNTNLSQGLTNLNYTPTAAAIQKADAALNQLPEGDVKKYIESHADEFDEQSIENTVASNSTALNANDAIASDISDADIEAYLSQGN